MALTAAELRAVYVVDEAPLDRSLAGVPGKVGKVKPGDVKIDGDDTGLQRAVGSAQGGMGRLTSTVKQSLGLMAGYFDFDSVVRFVGSAITAASDLSETINKSNTIFGQNAAVVNEWAQDSARSVGLSRQAALNAAAGFGDMFSQIGFAADEAAHLSTRVVQMSADLGSFNNLPTADVADRISAAFRGEYDSLQLLIPNINAARVETEALAMSGKKNAAELTAQEKAAAVLAIVQKDGARAMGDFARTSDGLANSQKILSAEWENAKARLGELLVGPMTGIVQFLTGSAIPAFDFLLTSVSTVVGVFADLPGPVQAALVTLAAVAALKGPLGSFFDVLPAKITGLVTGIGMATTSVGGFRAAAGGLVGFFGGPWGLALTGAVAGLTLLVSWLGDSGQATQQAEGYQRQLADALQESKGAIDDNVRALAAQAAAEAEVGDSNLLEVAEELGLSLPRVTDALLGNRDAYGELAAGADAYLQRALELANFNTEDPSFVAASEKVAAFKDVLGVNTEAMTGAVAENRRLAGATEESGAAAEGAADSQADLTTQLEGVQTAASEAKQQTDLFKLSLDFLTGATVSLAQVEAAFHAAIADADGALENMSGTVLDATGKLNLQSEAGRATQDTLLGIRDSANDWIATMIQQGATADQVNAKDAALRQSFWETARALTGSDQAAEDLTNQLYGIPGERHTTITADTGPATRAVNAFLAWDAVKTIPILGRVVGNVTGQTPPRAAGGPVWPGQTFLVGEEGPELVRFSGHGTVIPAGESARMMAAAGTSARIPVGAAASRPAAPVSAPAGGGGSLFHADTVNVIEGTPRDVAEELAYRMRLGGR